MAKHAPEKKGPAIEDDILVDFTGEVYTLVRRPHNGFANYAIATLTIKNGRVVGQTLSDPYAGFEATARLELANERLLSSLRKNYPPEFQHV